MYNYIYLCTTDTPPKKHRRIALELTHISLKAGPATILVLPIVVFLCYFACFSQRSYIEATALARVADGIQPSDALPQLDFQLPAARAVRTLRVGRAAALLEDVGAIPAIGARCAEKHSIAGSKSVQANIFFTSSIFFQSICSYCQ